MPFARSDWLTRRWLASTSSPPSNRRKRFLNFWPLVITFWSASYSACVVYTKTIIHLSVGESDGYLLPLRWIIVNYYSHCHCHYLLNVGTWASFGRDENSDSGLGKSLSSLCCNKAGVKAVVTISDIIKPTIKDKRSWDTDRKQTFSLEV